MPTNEREHGSVLHRFLRHPNGHLELVGRLVIATMIVGATITMIFLQTQIPDAWWAMATAVTAYLFQPSPKTIEARQKTPTSPNGTN